MVGGVKYGYGIGQLEITVDQWVDFLNTADPSGRNTHHLYAATESSAAWPKYGQIDFSASARQGPPLLGRLAGMGRQALRLRQLPALRPLRQLALQRQGALQEDEQRRRLQLRHLQGPPLAADRDRHVRPGRQPDGHPRPQARLRRSRARTSGSRPPTTTRTAAAPTPTGSTRPTPASSATAVRRARADDARPRRPATSPTPRPSRWPPSTPTGRGAELVPGRVHSAEACTTREPVRHRPRPPTKRPSRAASARSARR